jgi:hypothetical protein
MNMISREAHFRSGPRFFRNENGLDMFEHRIDASSCIGPRPATKRDKEINPDLWAAHLAEWTEAEDRKIRRQRARKED